MALEGDSGADSILCSPLRARCLRLSETLPTKPLSPSQPLPTGIASLAPPTLRNLYTTTLLCLIVPVRHHLRSLDEPRSSSPASYLSLARSPSLSFLFSRFSHASHQSFLSLVPSLSLSLSLSLGFLRMVEFRQLHSPHDDTSILESNALSLSMSCSSSSRSQLPFRQLIKRPCVRA
jgi:hypothetical protein